LEQAAEVVAGGGKDAIGCVALGSGEVVSGHAVLGLNVSDDRLDRRAAAQLPLDRFGDPASLAGDVVERGVVAALAAVGDDAGQVRAELGFHLRYHGRQGVPVIRIARQRLGVGDELRPSNDTRSWRSRP
jgi:hypothetical protein